LQPVNRLPPEVLSQITGYVPHEDDTDAWPIVRLTFVCRYWRELIASTPWNWTSISSRSGGLAALSLQRAKGLPLKLYLDMEWVIEPREFSELINPHIKNAESLYFSGFNTTTEIAQMFPNFTQSMPNLRSLTLDGPQVIKQMSSVDLPESLVPTLRYLEVAGIPLSSSFLRLRALTELVLYHSRPSLHLDTLLDFLEANHSLRSADLTIRPTGLIRTSLFVPQLRGAIVNRLQHLSTNYTCTMIGKALLSNIPLQRGAHLEIITDTNDGSDGVLFGVPAAQFPILLSPISMEYQSHKKSVRLLGPNESFSFQSSGRDGSLFGEFRLLPLTSVREFRLKHRRSEWMRNLEPVVFKPSVFQSPALETFAIDCEIQISQFLSTLLSNPSFFPSLRTLAFLNCDFSGDSMEALTRFASDRKKTTSAWLRRVVIVDSKGNLPSIASIDALERYVPIVNVGVGKELPKDLA
jgi:hypothetical protein